RSEGCESAGTVAADREAESEAAAGLVGVGAGERGAIVGLCLRLLAEEVVGEPAVATERRGARTELLGASEVGHGGFGVAVVSRDRAHSGLRKGASGIDLVGAREEAGGGLRVAKLERCAAGADQRLEVLGVLGERPDVAGQSRGCCFIVGRVAALRGGRR